MFCAKSLMQYHIKPLIVTICSLILLCLGIGEASERSVEVAQNRDSFQSIVEQLSSNVQNNNFMELKRKFKHQEHMRFGQCNTDIGFDLSVDDLIKILLDNSKSVEIKVNKRAGRGLIETEGWNSEYPYIYFYFTKAADSWTWLGACEDINRSLDFAMFLGGKDKQYDGPPKLPRKGPRVFQDEVALRERIKEIVKFKSFDALIPYATKNVLAFGQCSLSMMEKDKIESKEMPAQDIVNYLIKNVPASGKIVSSGMHHKTYYETTGWVGDYPFIAFWFSESNKGWELSGVSYCKTRHFDLFPPLPAFK